MKKYLIPCALAAATLAVSTSTAVAAENISVKAVMVPQESISMNFRDRSKHVVVLIR